VEDRLSLIARLKRKYGDTVADVLEHLETARRQLELLSGADERGLVLERGFLRRRDGLPRGAGR